MTESTAAEEIVVQTETPAVDPAPKRPRTEHPAPEPSVGRVVHYQEGEGEPLAALITVVKDKKTASLVIYREHLHMFRQAVPHSEKPKTGHWNWPPRVGA